MWKILKYLLPLLVVAPSVVVRASVWLIFRRIS